MDDSATPQPAENVSRSGLWHTLSQSLSDVRAQYLVAALAALLTTLVSRSIAPWVQLADLVIVHLLGAVAIATRFAVGPSLVCATLSILAFDYFFIPPLLRLAWPDSQSAITFVGMLVVAGVVSGLSRGLRREREAAQRSEANTLALQLFCQELSALGSLAQVRALGVRRLGALFASRVTLALSPGDGELDSLDLLGLSAEEQKLAHRAWETYSLVQEAHVVGHALWLPLMGSHRNLGVVGFAQNSARALSDPEVRRLLTLCVVQLAGAIERVMLSAAAHKAELQVETERARGSLLAAISHDLKTPLSSILMAAGTLESARHTLSMDQQSALLRTLVDEAERLTRLVSNVLSMTKLESLALMLRQEAEDVGDLVDGALRALSLRLSGRKVEVELAPDLPLVDADAVLVQQVLVNLLENAERYAPAGSPIRIEAFARDAQVFISVKDQGPGFAPDEREKVFEKFFRGRDAARGDGGVGLGLTICRAAVQAHGGKIYVKQDGNVGASVEFSLRARRD